ncbi:MAG: hypothetical protein P8Y60_10590, partial [Calditrichota bacterium]
CETGREGWGIRTRASVPWNLTRLENPKSPKYIKDWINWGAGPRASQYLILGAKTRAALQGRFTPEIDDVKICAIPVMRHRLVTNFNAEAEGVNTLQIVEKLLHEVRNP